jgi:hypothetical protein
MWSCMQQFSMLHKETAHAQCVFYKNCIIENFNNRGRSSGGTLYVLTRHGYHQ